ncbi:MAG: hypothetical protein ABSA92_12725 [Candidatus Bathyarchaeia archaeon]
MITTKLPLIGLLSENAQNQSQVPLQEQGTLSPSRGILPCKIDLGALCSGQLITGKFGVYATGTSTSSGKKNERL